MKYLYIVSFIAGLLLGVRLLFFGAERRRPQAYVLPLRRSEPALVAFLVMFGLVGYLLGPRQDNSLIVLAQSLTAAAVWAVIVTQIAIATARITPESNHDDPRFTLQGHVAVVSVPIEADGEGEILSDAQGASRLLRARNLGHGGIAAGEEVCIERIENGVAFVERWSLVEQRL